MNMMAIDPKEESEEVETPVVPSKELPEVEDDTEVLSSEDEDDDDDDDDDFDDNDDGDDEDKEDEDSPAS